MPVVYRLADIFVLPSKGPGETWGLAINEAMASGRGVIVSDKCGCSNDLVLAGKNGYVFENGNVDSLKNAMLLSLGSFKEQGAFSAKLITEWSYSRIVEQMEALFENKLI
jgi:glycosyltransferase involved in cell wall biosynthesis